MSLLKFIKLERSEIPQAPCRINLLEKNVQCIVDKERKKLNIYMHDLRRNNCNPSKLFIKVNLGSREITYPLKEWFYKRGILRYFPVMIINLEDEETNIKEITISIIEERQVKNHIWAIEVSEPITIPIKLPKPAEKPAPTKKPREYVEQVEQFEQTEHIEARIPVIEVPPPCKDGEHDWTIEHIFRNFRGDIVAVLYRCKKCGLTKRETT